MHRALFLDNATKPSTQETGPAPARLLTLALCPRVQRLGTLVSRSGGNEMYWLVTHLGYSDSFTFKLLLLGGRCRSV